MTQSAPEFTWVHLSDLRHAYAPLEPGDAAPFDWTRFLEALRDPPAALQRVDALFVTGDTGVEGGRYDEAAERLAQVADALCVARDRIYLVPGFHDVELARGTAEVAPLLEQLRSDHTSLDDALSSDRTRDQLLDRLHGFEELVASLGAVNLANLHTTTRPVRITCGGAIVRLVGLNTALLSTGVMDRARLRLGETQLVPLHHPANEPNEVVIVLASHPFRWLADAPVVRRRLDALADLVLTGHPTSGHVGLTATGGATEHLTLASGLVGAENNGPRRFGWWFGGIWIAGASAEARLWPRIWSAADGFVLDRTDVRADQDVIQRRLRIRAGGAPPSRRSPAVAVEGSPYVPPLVVHVAWHPASAFGRLVASEVFSLLERDSHDPFDQGLGIPVFFRSEPAGGSDVPGPLTLATDTVVIPVLDEHALADQSWRRYLGSLLVGPTRPEIFPLDLSADGFGPFSHLQGLRLHSAPPRDWMGLLGPAVMHHLFRLLRGGAPGGRPLKLFISHAKADGREQAMALRNDLAVRHPFDLYFDETSIAVGEEWSESLRAAARDENTLLIALQTDAYGSRVWCRNEVLFAKKGGRPIVVVLAVDRGERRSFPYLGNTPTIRWRPGSRPDRLGVVSAVLAEALRYEYVPTTLQALAQLAMPSSAAVAFPHHPDMSAIHFRLQAVQGDSPLVIYPDPPVSRDEADLLRAARKGVRLVTPSTLYTGGTT